MGVPRSPGKHEIRKQLDIQEIGGTRKFGFVMLSGKVAAFENLGLVFHSALESLCRLTSAPQTIAPHIKYISAGDYSRGHPSGLRVPHARACSTPSQVGQSRHSMPPTQPNPHIKSREREQPGRGRQSKGMSTPSDRTPTPT